LEGKFWYLYEHLVHFVVVCFISWDFGIFLAIRNIFPFWYIESIKIWQPCRMAQLQKVTKIQRLNAINNVSQCHGMTLPHGDVIVPTSFGFCLALYIYVLDITFKI
jgi:hypothetical protein